MCRCQGLSLDNFHNLNRPISVQTCQTRRGGGHGKDFVFVNEFVSNLVNGGGLLLKDVEHCIFLLVIVYLLGMYT